MFDLDKWQEVLEKIKKDNHSVEALLKSTEFKEMTNSKVIVEVFYEFHKNKLESNPNIALVERRIKEIFEKPLKIKYVLT